MDIQAKNSEPKAPVWSSLWFLWLVATAIYLFGFFTFGISEGIKDLYNHVDLEVLINVFTSIIGLFVPFGIFNGAAVLASFQDMSAITVFLPVATLVFIILLVKNGKMLSAHKSRPKLKLFINLGILVAITALVDFIIWGEWRSLILVFTGFN